MYLEDIFDVFTKYFPNSEPGPQRLKIEVKLKKLN